MNVQIAARLRPFSHLPGIVCMIPQTSIQVQVFPVLLRFTDLLTGAKWEEPLHWKGPVEGFTVQLDLEKGGIEIFGKTPLGFKRKALGDSVSTPVSTRIERLSLGKHTKLDWQLVWRRMQMEEIVPVLFQLGQQVPEGQGTTPILNLLNFSDKREVCQRLTAFFKTGFHGMMAPRLLDEDFQGIVEEKEVSGSPLVLLREGYRAVRALFFNEDQGFSFLPNLPPEFHAGRLLNLCTSKGDLLSLEWSKKQLKKVIIKPVQTREVQLELQKFLRSFRVNKKVKHAIKTSLTLVAGETLFLDRFEK